MTYRKQYMYSYSGFLQKNRCSKNCSCRDTSIKVLKATYCINKIKNGYKNVEKNQVAALVRSGTCSKYREIEREVVPIVTTRPFSLPCK